MLSRLRNMFRVPDLRNKIIFTLIIIGIYRVGAHLPVPFIDFNAIKDLQKQSENTGVVGFLDLFSGGAITNVAIFFLGTVFFLENGPKTWLLAGVSFPLGIVLVGFELFVAVLQAFIFAILSASYIGQALAEEH